MKTKVRECYEDYKEYCDEYSAEICDKTLKEEAWNDSVEFEDLINLFHEENDEYFKFFMLTRVLVFLNWKPVKKYLYEVMQHNRELYTKIRAAEFLIDMRDDPADYLIKFAQEAYEINDEYRLYSVVYMFLKLRNKKGALLFLSLLYKYPTLVKYLEERASKEVIEEANELANGCFIVKTRVREAYEDYRKCCKKYSDSECGAELYEDELKEESIRDPLEFEDLINLFHEEKDEHYKLLMLAKVLAFLKWEPIKKYLYEVMQSNTVFDNRVEAASYLLSMKDEGAFDWLFKFAQEAYEKNSLYSICDLEKVASVLLPFSSKKAAQVFLELMNKYPRLFKLFDERKNVIEDAKERANK